MLKKCSLTGEFTYAPFVCQFNLSVFSSDWVDPCSAEQDKPQLATLKNKGEGATSHQETQMGAELSFTGRKSGKILLPELGQTEIVQQKPNRKL